MSARVETPVLVVGAGPIGLVASTLLSRAGVEHLVIERREGLHGAPQAHVVTSRSMEIFRAAGVDEGAVRAVANAPEDIRSVLWMHTLAGPELGRFGMYDRERVETLLANTPSPMSNVAQHLLEPVLLEAARKAGARVDFRHEWRGLTQDADGVTSSVVDLATGEPYEIRSETVLACDGAGSRVRKAIGIEMQGPDRIQAFITICIDASFRDLVRERPGILYWHMDPEAGGVFIAHDIDSTWIYMHPHDPEREPLERFTEPVCRDIVKRAVGADADFEIRSVDSWTMTAQVAERYREGRVFLVGDAAHRFPPTGGVGMNTGIADAHNLVWKIAAVRDGRAGAALLDSYGPERRGVAQANTDQSFRNFAEMMKIAAALGLPSDEDMATVRARIRAIPDDPERRAAVQREIDDQAEHFEMTGLDLGQCYEEGALVPDGTPLRLPANPVRDYLPTTRPGARMPHAWVERAGERLSTLDLVDAREPVLLVGAGGDGWRDTPCAVVAIGPGCEVTDPDGSWTALREVAEDGALLVRPDGHVAWRSQGLPGDAAGEVARVLARILSR